MQKRKRNTLIGIGVLLIIVTIIMLVKVFTNEKIYTITFDTNGGSEINSLTINENEKIIKPEDPIREGYIFTGWYINDEEYDFNTKVKENITLEARWEKIEDEFSLNTNSLTLVVDEEALLETNSKDELTWKSSNENIAIVDARGKVKALQAGEAIITVTNKNGKSIICKVTIRKKETNEIEVTKITINGKNEVPVGSTIKLVANISPSNATNKTVTWKSSDSRYATVDNNGNVKGLKAGNVTIIATSNNGKTATYKITIKAKTSTGSKPTTGGNTSNNNQSGGSTPNVPSTQEKPKSIPITSITISGNKTVEETKTTKLSATVNPSNTTDDKTITWRSKNNGIVTVINNGTITGVKEGTTEVCAKAGKVEECVTITVTEKIVKYVITLTAIHEPSGAVRDYEITDVTADGTSFRNFVTFNYNGQNYLPTHIGTKISLLSGAVNTGITSATIKLPNQKKYNATIIYR